MKLRGNKGEWSELYVLLRLLAYKKLFAANEKVQRLEDVYFPVLKVFRNESESKRIEYNLMDEQIVDVYINDEKVQTLRTERLIKEANSLYSSIIAGSNRAFEIPESEKIIDALGCERLAAPASDKTDILMQIHDIHTGFKPVCGFSIKSELGNPPTLLNASGATNFVYKLPSMSEDEAKRINDINSRNKIIDRVTAISEVSEFRFVKAKNDIFGSNLMLIDSRMEEMLGHVLLIHYMTGINDCKKIIELLEEKNPMDFPRKGFYEYKFKKLLCSVALGMMPSSPWDGQDDANGGYIVVNSEGDVLAYHIYNRNYFEQYLLDNTKFERGSTSRHDYASIYECDGDMYINLNLQIRFK